MAQLATQPPSLVNQPQDKHHCTKESEDPAENERDRKCERYGSANRRNKEIQVNKAGIAARENQHHPKHEGDENSDANFLQQVTAPSDLQAHRPNGRKHQQSIALEEIW